MSQVKAFMSRGNDYLRLDGVRGGLSAEREARAILAVSEPEKASAHLFLADHRTGSVPAYSRALATALAAFVGEES